VSQQVTHPVEATTGPAATAARAAELYDVHRQNVYRRADRMFAVLMAVQWIFGIAAAVFISPRT